MIKINLTFTRRRRMKKIMLLFLALLLNPMLFSEKKALKKDLKKTKAEDKKPIRKTPNLLASIYEKIDQIDEHTFRADKLAFKKLLEKLKPLVEEATAEEKKIIKEKTEKEFIKSIKDIITVTDRKEKLSHVKKLINDIAQALSITIDTAGIPDAASATTPAIPVAATPASATPTIQPAVAPAPVTPPTDAVAAPAVQAPAVPAAGAPAPTTPPPAAPAVK